MMQILVYVAYVQGPVFLAMGFYAKVRTTKDYLEVVRDERDEIIENRLDT